MIKGFTNNTNIKVYHAVEMLEAKLTNDIEMQQIIEFSAQFFLFWVIEVKCRPRAYGEEFLKTKRGFCS